MVYSTVTLFDNHSRQLYKQLSQKTLQINQIDNVSSVCPEETK